MRKLPLFSLCFCSLLTAAAIAQNVSGKESAAIPTIREKTAGMKHLDGLVPLDWDAKAGKLYLEVPRFDESGKSVDLIYATSLPFGTGSNDLGLDRGQVSEGRIVHFERSGPKVLLVQPNMAFRTSSNDRDEQLAVKQSFAESVLWGFTVAAESAEGAVLIDATDFFLHDVHGVADALAQAKQGSYRVDASRSAIEMEDTKAFPKNTEVEAELTFVTDGTEKAIFVRDVTPDPHAMTIRERTSFIELPGPGFTPRRFVSRAGFFENRYRDYTAPLGEPLDQLFLVRHRLTKQDPKCTADCKAVAPIQYYVDRGAPEPVRTALVEGARWWDEAFQAAGWAKGTFRVDVLPEGADAMDVRYNIIQWVHRYTRGWSYGSAIADPRTGEIIKGNVTLGSLRARQDYLIAEALLAPYADGKAPADDPMLKMVLARIRQLSAHETGHTLGLSHNFAASTVKQGDSVMDYPHPLMTLDSSGHIDASHAYAAGIGDWDKVAIDYGYREFAKGTSADEQNAALAKILTDADRAGQVFITDEDARPFGSAHPRAHLWDNGSDPAAELDRVLEVRAAALKNFGENAVRRGTPMAELEKTLVPLYLFHRYQTEAAIKEIGGLDYRYNQRGDGLPDPTIVDAKVQKQALQAVLKTLAPETLTLPESILKLLPPVPPGYPRTRESFPSHTGLTFDPVAAAESAADLTLKVLLDAERASRMIEYHMRAPGSTSLREMMEAISAKVAERPEGGHTMSSEVERAVEFRALEAQMELAVDPGASSQARAIALWHLRDVLNQWKSTPMPKDTAEAIHRAAMVDRLERFEQDPAKFVPSKTVEAPPGMPIGDDEDWN
ncbi:zinc-dependent metalloprotease [Occallatibacter savannae]|uniref:zinc-dependent metalloprotease n=1 Tax=Occallatibacter savannae TaxID=1002691 RepID=UPI000D68D375|nr:zinc-dependent metalloprotease [Occallatibacter savannae]